MHVEEDVQSTNERFLGCIWVLGLHPVRGIEFLSNCLFQESFPSQRI